MPRFIPAGQYTVSVSPNQADQRYNAPVGYFQTMHIPTFDWYLWRCLRLQDNL
ncbi:MAG: hypothetical protein GY820_20290 [Gammaproteobacteria bacterium]|nr:hypothetical protein [Gammaproteobacteria bacterium]